MAADTPRTDAERLVATWRARARQQWSDDFKLASEFGIRKRYDALDLQRAVDQCADELEALLRARRGGAPQERCPVHVSGLHDFNESGFCGCNAFRKPGEASAPPQERLSALARRIRPKHEYCAANGESLCRDRNYPEDSSCGSCNRWRWADELEAAIAGEASPAHGAAPPQEPVLCEACAAGYRLAENGIHYNDAAGGWTWGVCRKVVRLLRSKGAAQPQEPDTVTNG